MLRLFAHAALELLDFRRLLTHDVIPVLDGRERNGEEGTAPTELDKVYPLGGYASFRTDWAAPSDTVVVHLRSAKHSIAHYHPDETTFEVFGFGKELIVDAGYHSYDRADVFHEYQKHPRAHNVLTIDGAGFARLNPSPSPRTCSSSKRRESTLCGGVTRKAPTLWQSHPHPIHESRRSVPWPARTTLVRVLSASVHAWDTRTAISRT